MRTQTRLPGVPTPLPALDTGRAEPERRPDYRTVEVVATSAAGIQDAIDGALQRASRALPHLEWFEVTELRGCVVDGRAARWQVGLRLGYRLEPTDRNPRPADPVAGA